jgi:hypothetical protein
MSAQAKSGSGPGDSALASNPTLRIEDGLRFSALCRRQRTEPRLGRARPILLTRDDLIALADSADAQTYHSGTFNNECRVDRRAAI